MREGVDTESSKMRGGETEEVSEKERRKERRGPGVS